MAGETKAPRVKDCTITADGCIIVEFNRDFGYPGITRALFLPDTLHLLAGAFADMPDPEETEFPGVPQVNDDAVVEAVDALGEDTGGAGDNGQAETEGGDEQE